MMWLLSIMLFVVVDARAQTAFTVMEYNCENVFDTIHDEGKNDYEFAYGGERHWRRWKLAKKLREIAKVIAAADEHRPVDLVGLCEVENDTVMTQLAERSVLAAMGYKYVMTDSDDPRGIDVALLYSPFTFHPFETHSINPSAALKRPTRHILRVSGTIATGDTLDVYVLHLPSKLGGVEAYRQSVKIARLLRADVDSVMRARSKPNVILMGDFNAGPKSKQLRILTGGTGITDLTAKVKPGTYKFQGEWDTIDHILSLTTSLRHTGSQVLALPQLLDIDSVNGGHKPRRTYLGPAYKGGVSDHLPLVSRFTIVADGE